MEFPALDLTGTQQKQSACNTFLQKHANLDKQHAGNEPAGWQAQAHLLDACASNKQQGCNKAGKTQGGVCRFKR